MVGIAGVSGNGQRELLAALCGESRGPHSGELRICGRAADDLDPAERRQLGLTFVPEERLGRGSVPAMSLTQNAVLTGSHFGLVRNGLVRGAPHAPLLAKRSQHSKSKALTRTPWRRASQEATCRNSLSGARSVLSRTS